MASSSKNGSIRAGGVTFGPRRTRRRDLTQQETDITSLAEGYVTLTPLDFDLTKRNTLAEMQRWSWKMTGH